MKEIYFTSDTHFGDKRVLEYSKRPFENINEMNESMIRNWNDTVKQEDYVYHLGDFGDPEVLKFLNGKITLITGNYELNPNKSNIEDFEKSRKIEEICPFKKLTIDGREYLLVHKPSMSDNFTSFFEQENPFVLFGHIHKLQMVKEFGLNVGTDCHNFKPINVDTVLFYKNAIQNIYDHNVFC